MNYIKEINAFYDTIERHPLSASAVTLWHALMHINNKTHWQKSFTAAAAVLQYKSRLTESSFKRARKELVTEGYITHARGKPHQAPTYRMIPLTRDENVPTGDQNIPAHALTPAAGATTQETVQHPSPKTHPNEQPNANHTEEPNTLPNTNQPTDPNKHPNVKQNANPNTDQPTDQLTDRSVDRPADQQPATLIKQNQTKHQTKQNNNNEKPSDIIQPDAIHFYGQNFGIASPYVAESILSWTHDMPEELIIHAMERALEQGKAHWGYVKGILKAWLRKDIHTIQDAKSDAVQFRNQNQAPKQTNVSEIIPDWFHEQYQPGSQHTSKHNPYSKQEEAAIHQETQALIDTL